MISTPLHAVYLYILYQPVEYHWAARHIRSYSVMSLEISRVEVASLTQAYFKISERSRSFTDELFAALLAENLVEIGWTHMETWVLITIMGPYGSMVFLNFPHEPIKTQWIGWRCGRQSQQVSVFCAWYICIASLYVFVLKVDGWPSRKKSKVRMLLKRLKMDPQNRQRQICIPQGSNMWRTMIHVRSLFEFPLQWTCAWHEIEFPSRFNIIKVY